MVLQFSSSSMAHLNSYASILPAVVAAQNSPKKPHDASILSLHASSYVLRLSLHLLGAAPAAAAFLPAIPSGAVPAASRSGRLPHSCSSSKSASSSAEASWYCWYSLTRSFMLDSASVNSISSMPSPAQRSAA